MDLKKEKEKEKEGERIVFPSRKHNTISQTS